jgi:hypothetical protein
VARLEEIGILRGSGEGRARSFTATPEGFAALLLNLGALRADPTLDGTEFELKRSLVAMLNLLFERLADLPEETPAPPEIERFFAEAGRIAVRGRKVITEEVERQALDVLRLIAEQRRQVESRLRSAREGLARAGRGEEGDVDLARLAENGFGEVSSLLAETPEALAALRRLARGAFPRLRHAAAALRYERYLEYLDGLASLYAAELKTVGLAAYLAARRSPLTSPGPPLPEGEEGERQR